MADRGEGIAMVFGCAGNCTAKTFRLTSCGMCGVSAVGFSGGREGAGKEYPLRG